MSFDTNSITVLISGTRDGLPQSVYEAALTYLPLAKEYTLVHGAARGVDNDFSTLCRSKGWKIIGFPYLSQHGRAGGPLRNQQMIDASKPVFGIFLPSSTSKGTYDCYQRFRRSCPNSKGIIYNPSTNTFTSF